MYAALQLRRSLPFSFKPKKKPHGLLCPTFTRWQSQRTKVALMLRLAPHLRSLSASLLLGMIVGCGCGILGALFLYCLEAAEATRAAYPKLLLGLPLLGLALGALYQRFGRSISGGNNLIIDALADGGPVVPHRMVPMGLFGTAAIHLFGGSVGQEGTAMQLGAALADGMHHRLHLLPSLRQSCLLAGVAGGFSSVFGTPVAAALFALQLAHAKRIEMQHLPTVAVAALSASWTATGFGAGHPAYPAIPVLALTPQVALAWLVFAGAMALASTLFVQCTDFVRHTSAHIVPSLPLRMAMGGAAVIGMTWILKTDLYLGGGLIHTVHVVHGGGAADGAWLMKLIFTAICLGTGYGGGEVTPLFFMGATLGHTLAPWLHLPPGMAAAVGMAAILSSATKAPLAWMVLVCELMGTQILLHALLACSFAAAISGKQRIYSAQRGHGTKPDLTIKSANL